MNLHRNFKRLRWPIFLACALSLGCAGLRTENHPETPADWRSELQPDLLQSESDRIAAGLGLHQALGLALDRNPGVQAQRLHWLAAIHVEPQAVTPPDPVAQFGYQFDSVETRAGPQRWSLGLMQNIPWFHNLWARGRIAARRADVARLRYESSVRDLIIDVKDAWYELYYLDAAVRITETIEQTLRNQGLLAYAELESGRTSLSESFRAESQAAQLAYDRFLLAEQRAAQAERLKSLLNLPPATRIGPVSSAPLYTISNDLDALYRRAERHAQVLRIRGLEIERSAYETFLAKLARVPDFGVGLSYIQTGDARGPSSMRPSDSGKDPFIGLFSVRLPIWEQRNRALIREKQALEQAVKQQALDESNRVRQAVAQAWFQVRLTERLAALYADTLLPQAENVMRQAEIYFRAEQSAFSSVIETTLAWHNFLLAHHRAVADHGQAIGRLEKALGTTAEPRRLDQPQPAGEEWD